MFEAIKMTASAPLTFLENLNVRMNVVPEHTPSRHGPFFGKSFLNHLSLMSSECIQIWLGTHFTKQENNAPSRCRSLFPNGSVKTQQLDSSRNVGNNAFMLIAHAAVRSTNTFFSMSLFALLMPQSTFG
jgi:hypothetical protein